jgi:hypothetical protein
MSKEFSVAGITFAVKDNQSLMTMRPEGVVTFNHEPENQYDKGAIRIEIGGVKLGYVPKGHFQDAIREAGILIGTVVNYSYRDAGGFNNDHKGQLGSITVSFKDGSEVNEQAGGRIAGGKYLRVTSFISYFDAYGGGDGLIKWAFDNGDTYDEYKAALNLTAENGTLMHAAIEAYLVGKGEFVIDADMGISEATYPLGSVESVSDWLPAGWAHFIATYEIDVCYMEERFFDNELMVCGQPDLICFIRERKKKDAKLSLMVLDWKSSKKPSIKHKIQISIYAKNVQWDGQSVDGAVIVAFGSENKKGYATSKVTAEQIEQNYTGMKHLRKLIDLCAPTYNMKFWEGA